MELAQDGQWRKPASPEGRTRWVASSYIGDMTETPLTEPHEQTSPPYVSRRASSSGGLARYRHRNYPEPDQDSYSHAGHRCLRDPQRHQVPPPTLQ